MKIEDLVKELKKPYKIEIDSINERYFIPEDKGNYFNIFKDHSKPKIRALLCEGKINSIQVSERGKFFTDVRIEIIPKQICSGYDLFDLLDSREYSFAGSNGSSVDILEFILGERVGSIDAESFKDRNIHIIEVILPANRIAYPVG